MLKQRRPSHDAARDDAGANRSSWNYEFIYYTEADQVVHSGTLEPLLENLTLDPRIIVVPSRGEEMLDHRKCTEECRGHEEPDSPCMLACVNDDAGHRYSLRQNCLDMPRHAPAGKGRRSAPVQRPHEMSPSRPARPGGRRSML